MPLLLEEEVVVEVLVFVYVDELEVEVVLEELVVLEVEEFVDVVELLLELEDVE